MEFQLQFTLTMQLWMQSVDQPTPEYAELYLQTNAKLDEKLPKITRLDHQEKACGHTYSSITYGKLGRT